ncbi:MAG TPA: hypothetical protein VFI00_12190 [Kribbella sp.]|nr:hypothetical protein [Kribbella sp.]
MRFKLNRDRAAARQARVPHRLPQGGDSVIEVFTYEVDKTSREPQLDVAGFAYAELAGGSPADLPSQAAPDGTTVYIDPDGFAFAVGSEA